VIAELVSNEEIAAAHEVTLRTVQGWVQRRGGRPFESIEESRAWVAENIGPNGVSLGDRRAGRAKIPRDKLDEEEQRARIEKLREEARQKQLKNDQLEGRLWDAAGVLTTWRQAMNVLRARLQEIPQSLAADLPLEYRDQQIQRADELLRLAMKELEDTQLDP
jgi:phage terminase Nu1 subunit (DNA packaging protein)